MKKRFTTTIDDEIIKKLKIQAVIESNTAANVIEEAIQYYVDTHSNKD